MKENIVDKVMALSKKSKIVIGLAVLVVAVLGWKLFGSSSTQTSPSTNQTTTLSKGTLVSSISSSGTITSSGITSVSTKASGTVSAVYVADGDTVVKDQKLATLTLDEYGQERQSSAWVAYLDAKEAVVKAEGDKTSLQAKIWSDKKAIIDAESAIDKMQIATSGYTDEEKNITLESLNTARAAFNNDASTLQDADANISNAKVAVKSAWKDYQIASGTIYAPASGVISSLSLSLGQVIETSNNTNSASPTVNAQTVGVIHNPGAVYQAQVNLTELDIVSVKSGQKVTITMDAYPDTDFTGKVLSVDVSGTSSSGVTSYPVTIAFDPTDKELYTNMSVTANIITNIETGVLLVPTTAITTSNSGVSTVEKMVDGTPIQTTVTLGASNSSMTIVTEGLSEGDTIVSYSSDLKSAKNDNTSSAFNSSNNRGFGGIMGGPGGL